MADTPDDALNQLRATIAQLEQAATGSITEISQLKQLRRQAEGLRRQVVIGKLTQLAAYQRQFNELVCGKQRGRPTTLSPQATQLRDTIAALEAEIRELGV